VAYAVLVVWLDDEEEYLKEGLSDSVVARFSSRKEAKKQRDFMMMGMSEEVNGIHVVPFPRKTR
jgi:hypothetical protein